MGFLDEIKEGVKDALTVDKSDKDESAEAPAPTPADTADSAADKAAADKAAAAKKEAVHDRLEAEEKARKEEVHDRLEAEEKARKEAAHKEAAAEAKKEAAEHRTYTVKSGDTLSEIGARFGVDWRDIAKLNHLSNPDLIHPGDVFKIPAK